jgi:hypothetical protein
MIDIEAGETAGSEDDLYPNPAILVGGDIRRRVRALLGVFLRMGFASEHLNPIGLRSSIACGPKRCIGRVVYRWI